jgi:hypothetical protein
MGNEPMNASNMDATQKGEVKECGCGRYVWVKKHYRYE